MKVSKERSDYSPHEWTAGAFNLPRLVSIIGIKLTAYIGGATTTQSVVDWLRNGLPADIEPRMRAALDIANPIAEAESRFLAQGFLIRIWEGTGPYRTPAGMLREADAGVARQLLTRLAAAEYLLKRGSQSRRRRRSPAGVDQPRGTSGTCGLHPQALAGSAVVTDPCPQRLSRRTE
jgi:hypothetical protein